MSKSTHYPLTHDEFLRLNAELKDAELRVYLYLMTLNPFPNSIMEIDTAQISERLGITRRTVQRAVKRLCELQLIEIEITKFKYKKAVHGASSRLGSDDIRIANDDIRIALSDPNVATNDIRIATDDIRIVTNDIRIATTPVKPLLGKDSSTPQIDQIYSDFIKSLSEEERANFLNFVREKTKNLSQEVNDIEAWLAHQNKAGQNRWEVYYKKFVDWQQGQSKKSQSNRGSQMMKKFQEELEQQRQQAMSMSANS